MTLHSPSTPSTVPIPGGGQLVLDDGVLEPFRLAPEEAGQQLPRRCYAASHVAMQPGYRDVGHSIQSPGTSEEIAQWIDWDTSMAFRRRLDSLGFGIAEAMDTAQRFELGWAGARQLIEATGELGLRNGFIGAASADHADGLENAADLAAALAEQGRFVESCGGVPIILPQPWLTASAADEATYVRVYCDAIDAIEGPVLLHWLSEAFHPAMKGYFPGDSLRTILAHDRQKVRGMKISMLDRELEESLRAELAEHGQVILTGDDYHFAGLIEGHSQESIALPELDGRPLQGGAFSHALLGILNAVAVPASLALRHLGRGDVETYRKLMGPCEALGKEIFIAAETVLVPMLPTVAHHAFEDSLCSYDEMFWASKLHFSISQLS
ncbi:MAG: DUF993 family protein, partial [Planctomycetota bacterium]